MRCFRRHLWAALHAAFLASRSCGAATECPLGPMCTYATETSGGCTISAPYARTIIEHFEAGVWKEMVQQASICENASFTSVERCMVTPNCEVDLKNGRCITSRTWQASKLAPPLEDGGAGLGAGRCGVLGKVFEYGSDCLNRTDVACKAWENATLEGRFKFSVGGLALNSSAVKEAGGPVSVSYYDCPYEIKRASCNAGGDGLCHIGILRQVCEASQTALLAAMHREYKDEVASLALRRQHCGRYGAATRCVNAGCRWVESPSASGGGSNTTSSSVEGDQSLAVRTYQGSCTLPAMDALLGLIGEACPLRSMLLRHVDCGQATDESSCRDALPVNSKLETVPRCIWTGTACKSHVMALELDILPTLIPRHATIAKLTRDAIRICGNLETSDECTAKCAPGLSGAPSSLRPSVAATMLAAFVVTLGMVGASSASLAAH